MKIEELVIGERYIFNDSHTQVYEFVGVIWNDNTRSIVLRSVKTQQCHIHTDLTNLIKEPVAFVRNVPVYVGDPLYYKTWDETIEEYEIVTKIGANHIRVIRKDNGNQFSIHIDENNLYTTRPKRKVKKSGWLNIYRNMDAVFHSTKETADAHATHTRVECVECFWTQDE